MLTRQRSAPEVLRAAADHGISEDRARELVSLLERAASSGLRSPRGGGRVCPGTSRHQHRYYAGF